jgi:putative sterol carrier protein
MATKKQVETKLRQMIDRLGDADDDVHDNLTRALPDPRTVQIDVTDLDLSYWTELADGELGPLQPGQPSDCDIKLRASSDDLVAMINGELGLLKSYLSGRVRIEASLSDLLALRKLA